MANVKFGIFTDLHVDIMHDCEQRLRTFLEEARRADVDFIVQLGDFCYPDENRACICKPEKRPVNIENAMNYPTYADKDMIRKLFFDFDKPAYSVIGNHDLDMCSGEEMLKYYHMPARYYSFDYGGVHFIAIDANYCYIDGKYIPYDNGIYFDWSYDKPKPLPYIPQEELAWLKEDLQKTPYPSVLFSHQMLRQGDLNNYEAFQAVINNAPNPVILSANGHLHKDNMTKIGKTWYWNVNSMSNYWIGENYTAKRYSDEIDEKYPNIRYVVPYKDPIFAIVTITDGVIDIRGRKSEFVGITPAEQGYPMSKWEDVVSPSISDYNISW